MRPSRFVPAFFLALLIAFPDRSYTRIIAPGVYCGYLIEDRWGRDLFHNGPQHLFVSEDVAWQLRKKRNKPLRLEVSKMYQPMNPGTGMIQGVESVSICEPVPRGLWLSIKPELEHIRRGEGLRVELTLRNTSDTTIRVFGENLGVALVAKARTSNAEMGYRDPDDRAYWYYTSDYLSFEKKPLLTRLADRFLRRAPPPAPFTVDMVACHVVRPWSYREDHRRDMAVVPPAPAPPRAVRIDLQPKGRLSRTIRLGKKLLPGEYEVVFFAWTESWHDTPGPMSERIPFDVRESNK
jgi:hypothetical protein